MRRPSRISQALARILPSDLPTTTTSGALIPVGSPAPDFALPADDGTTVRLSELRGHNVVLAFYPKDDTPG
jgi:peroxiredoxin